MHEVDRSVGAGSVVRAIVLSGLLLVAFTYLNAVSLVQRLPVNLGQLGAVVVFLALLPAFVSDRRVPGSLVLVAALWASFALVVPYSVDSVYGAQKVRDLFTIALLAVAGGVLLLRTDRARQVWLGLVVGLGFVVAAAAYLLPGATVAETGRVAVEGGSAISTGRAAGAAAVVLIALVLGRARQRWVLLATSAGLLLTVLASGSRGPLLSAAIAVVAVAIIPARQRWVRVVLLGALVGMAYYLVAHSTYSSDRFADAGLSGENRLRFWQTTWEQAQAHPLGLGWGGLQPYILGRTYPHNIVLEAAGEGGLLAAGLLVAVLVVAVWAQAKAARASAVEMAMLGLLVFLLVNAMVSSDLSGNRGLWVMVGAALVSGLPRGYSSGHERERDEVRVGAAVGGSGAVHRRSADSR